METNLSKLRALSEDDKTENAMLRSRITDQSQLIMILKQRADEATISLKSLEKVNKELENFRENAEDRLNSELKKFNILDDRFMDLASNHEEMIRIKDEYKNRNKELMKENSQLRNDNSKLFSKAIEERNEVIRDLEKGIFEIREAYTSLEKKFQ
ncbi:hypothetical protein CAPTEDRAFT_136474 [Capitella teleta]|uniref:Transforming acidic coiled-coil-containing protein C-terminal domain-containing protein n=1 Tax=Capitella teleta TaxID=283909 RepID=R7TEZ9_CAPTE|nr:hypothetical protein CAPTEDRAFT_136474 [Capitella teleta]|eukprot:ELT92309.1 hypothetical protein CAPTEDRAFT_136474 [Capitella teleta]